MFFHILQIQKFHGAFLLNNVSKCKTNTVIQKILIYTKLQPKLSKFNASFFVTPFTLQIFNTEQLHI